MKAIRLLNLTITSSLQKITTELVSTENISLGFVKKPYQLALAVLGYVLSDFK